MKKSDLPKAPPLPDFDAEALSVAERVAAAHDPQAATKAIYVALLEMYDRGRRDGRTHLGDLLSAAGR